MYFIEMSNFNTLASFYQGKRVLITGHTGFKGAWLWTWLRHWGAELWGYALEPEGEQALFRHLPEAWGQSRLADLRDKIQLREYIREIQPQLIFHLAAQPLVLRAYEDPIYTLETNVLGTAYLLEALEELQAPCQVVCITTDKVYENREWVYPYRELDPLGGHDLYSSSKACAELVASAWRRSFGANKPWALATARAGNVIGGGDFAAYRILPDAVRAWTAGESLLLRHPGAIRPWQHVLEALSGYLLLAYRLAQNPTAYAQAYNFGPLLDEAIPVAQLIQWAAEHWPGADFQILDQAHKPHEAHYLRLDCSKAAQELAWRPHWSVQEAVAQSLNWYRQFYQQPQDAAQLCLDQIQAYCRQV